MFIAKHAAAITLENVGAIHPPDFADETFPLSTARLSSLVTWDSSIASNGYSVGNPARRQVLIP
jgi:hypothetical protein